MTSPLHLTFDVADAVAVGVVEAPDVDLVEGRALPPRHTRLLLAAVGRDRETEHGCQQRGPPHPEDDLCERGMLSKCTCYLAVPLFDHVIVSLTKQTSRTLFQKGVSLKRSSSSLFIPENGLSSGCSSPTGTSTEPLLDTAMRVCSIQQVMNRYSNAFLTCVWLRSLLIFKSLVFHRRIFLF